MIDENLISFMIFILILGLALFKDRKNIKFEGLLLIRRTKKGKRFIEKVARKHKRFWNILGFVAIIIAIPAGIIGFAFLFRNAYLIIKGVGGPGAGLVLPGPVSQVEVKPGLFILPPWLWILCIATVIIPHEIFHGLVASANKIKLKSLGWLLLVFIPGAFVEPDEYALKKSDVKTKLKIYAVGSLANFLVALSILTLGFLFYPYCFKPIGISYSSNIEGYPASLVNLSGIIQEINGVPIKSLEDLERTLENIPPGTEIQIKTTTGIFNLTTVSGKNRNGSFIGIAGPFKIHYEFNKILKWIFLLNFWIGLVNLLPIKPLDGGLILEAISKKYIKRADHFVHAVSLITLFLLIFNIVGPYLIDFLQNF